METRRTKRVARVEKATAAVAKNSAAGPIEVLHVLLHDGRARHDGSTRRQRRRRGSGAGSLRNCSDGLGLEAIIRLHGRDRE